MAGKYEIQKFTPKESWNFSRRSILTIQLATYEFLILPERALTVSWTYSDPDGKSACQLYLSYKKKIAN